MIEKVIFNGDGCSGYVTSSKDEIDSLIDKIPIELCGTIIQLGEMTDLVGFFNRPAEYIGQLKETPGDDIRGMVIYCGAEEERLFPRFYFQEIFRVASNRLFKVTGNGTGRDFLWKPERGWK